jgi:hypothetical protein
MNLPISIQITHTPDATPASPRVRRHTSHENATASMRMRFWKKPPMTSERGAMAPRNDARWDATERNLPRAIPPT